jgi:hypothetical protein
VYKWYGMLLRCYCYIHDNKKRVSTSDAINQGVGQIWGRDGNSSGMIKGVFEMKKNMCLPFTLELCDGSWQMCSGIIANTMKSTWQSVICAVWSRLLYTNGMNDPASSHSFLYCTSYSGATVALIDKQCCMTCSREIIGKRLSKFQEINNIISIIIISRAIKSCCIF